MIRILLFAECIALSQLIICAEPLLMPKSPTSPVNLWGKKPSTPVSIKLPCPDEQFLKNYENLTTKFEDCYTISLMCAHRLKRKDLYCIAARYWRLAGTPEPTLTKAHNNMLLTCIATQDTQCSFKLQSSKYNVTMPNTYSKGYL